MYEVPWRGVARVQVTADGFGGLGELDSSDI
jgi:hypothetical protein